MGAVFLFSLTLAAQLPKVEPLPMQPRVTIERPMAAPVLVILEEGKRPRWTWERSWVAIRRKAKAQ